MKKIISRTLCPCVLFAAIILFSGTLLADDISFEASVSASKVALGVPFRLSLTVHGTQDIAVVPLPTIEGFESRYIGPSSQVSVVNNQYTAKKSFNYQMVPVKEGKWVIPPVEVQIKGATYRTETVLIEVGPAGAAVDGAKNAEADISGKIKMIMVSPRRDVYMGETLPVVIKLYVNDADLRDISFPAITGDGFMALGFAQPKRYQENVGGVVFQVIEFLTGVVPTRDGDVVLGPSIIEAAIPVKMEQVDDPSGVFGNDFFRGFFGGYQKRGVRVSAEPFVLNVRALPEVGRPSFFSGAIGQFDVAVEVSPKEVKAGDPVTVRMTVKGGGDLKNAQIPPYKPDGFKAYDPQIKNNEDGSLVFEQVLIPSGSTLKEVPAISFNYFDPSKGQYETVLRGPFSIKVEDPPPGQEFKAVGFSSEGGNGAERFGRDIVFIKDQPGVLHVKGDLWSGPWLFLLAVILYLNIWGGLFAFRRHQFRLESDGPFARRIRARQEARKGMKALTAYVGNSKSMAGESRRILDVFLADVFDLPPGAIATGNMKELLAEQQISLPTMERMIRVMDTCNAACFASVSLSSEESGRMITDLNDVINDIERRCV